MIDPRPPEDLLGKLHHLKVLLGECRRHEQLEEREYEDVRIGLIEAEDAINDALEGWPA